MKRLLVVIFFGFMVVGCPLAFAQDETAQAQTSQNPLLSAVAQTAPDRLSNLINQLQRLREGTRPGKERSGPRRFATATELAVIAANPAFAQAYQRYPDDTLVVLRCAMEAIHSSVGDD